MKILLIDVDEGSAKQLEEKHELLLGTFGSPYRIAEPTTTFGAAAPAALILTARLPKGFGEADALVVDLRTPRGPAVAHDEYIGPRGMRAYPEAPDGVVDPRAFSMLAARARLDRIVAHGGVAIVFVEPPKALSLAMGTPSAGGTRQSSDTWGFLSNLRASVKIERDEGQEISLSDDVQSKYPDLARVLSDHLDSAHFSAHLSPLVRGCTPILTNKFGQAVGMILDLGGNLGPVLLLPHFENQRFLADLVSAALPSMVPSLFPDAAAQAWREDDAYQPPEVIRLRTEIRAVRDSAEARVEELDDEIAKLQAESGYELDLLTETGKPLVQAVARAFAELGFTDVVDVDEELAREETGGNRHEDLQIRDMNPQAVVEVKGLNSLPTDSDALQVLKYIVRRQRELHEDVVGFSIMNHHRTVPPIDRPRERIFTAAAVASAEETKIGLVTTVALFRLLRGRSRWNYPRDATRAAFDGCGLVPLIPGHYRGLGVVKHVYKKAGAVEVELTEGSIKLGNRIAFEQPLEFLEQEVTSLQRDGTDVDELGIGEIAGIQSSYVGVRVGARVYAVQE